MGNTAGSHLFQTPSTSPTSPSPPRLLSSSSALTLQTSFHAVTQENTFPANSAQRESPVLGDSVSPTGASQRPPQCAGQPCLRGDVEAVQEMALSLIRLLEQHGASLGLGSGPGTGAGAAVLLKCLLAEREKMVAEIQSLKETLKTEQAEWDQFQSDLQVAVSVADRLRLEADEALRSLRDTHTHTQQRLTEAMHRQDQTERELESVRSELAETQHTLHTLSTEHQKKLAELDMFVQRSRIKLSKEQQTLESGQAGADKEKRNQGTITEQRCEMFLDGDNWNPVETLELRGAEEMEQHALKSVDLLKTEEIEETEVRKMEEDSCVREPQKIMMLSERSRSLSQIPLPTSSSSVLHGSSVSLTTTASPVKSQEVVKGRRTDWLLQRQDSWSRGLRGKQEGEPGSDSSSVSSSKIGPQDGFSLLLRRHGGSRRNSLLRWSQSRTQGYKNIEITNFSSSWEDGLAFCALYHSYLPTHVHYSSLKAEEKKQNLDLAFHTGENVGIKATLTVEEMLREDGPDWQRVLGYVESMYRHFEM
ncbi:cytospin-A-like [Astyanax mexicanus]|uniref:Cytospin-A n=1 Tax=Astyanax mexicanus TaxID=7994 RepID=A0A8T2MIZ3_ASTMX|nr:cytospin-A-like [Astyanax mexicanus]